MNLSAGLCRSQEAFHQDRAARAQQALAAERREARQARPEPVPSGTESRAAREAHDRLFSENPDRGFESP